MGTRLGTRLGTQLGTVLGTDLAGSSGPTILGTVWMGDSLTVVNAPVGATLQWTRDGVDIVGATNSTYVVTSPDIGPDINCKVNGTPLVAVRHYFSDVATRLNLLLAYCWDIRDLTAGAVTTFADRMVGFVWSGVGSCDTSINSKKTLVLSGGATSGFESVGNATRLTGARAVWAPMALQRTGTIFTISTILELSTSSGVTGSPNGGFSVHTRDTSPAVARVVCAGAPASGISQWYSADAAASLSSPTVWLPSWDSNYRSAEVGHRINGVHQPYTSLTSLNDSDTDPFTGGLGTYQLSLGRRLGGSFRLTGKFVGAIPIFASFASGKNGTMTWEGMQHCELLQSYLSGVSVSVSADPNANSGYVVGAGGQSNEVGIDTNYGPLPDGPNPPADVGARLLRLYNTDLALTSMTEPIHGTGAGHSTTLAATIARAAGFPTGNIITASAPPQSGSAISTWQKGQPSYSRLFSSIYTAYRRWGALPILLDWYQGEADCASLALANAFQAATNQFFTDLRADLTAALGIPRLRIAQSLIYPGYGGSNGTIVRAAQLALVDADTIAIDTSGLVLMPDLTHLDAISQWTHGNDKGAAFLAAWPTPP